MKIKGHAAHRSLIDLEVAGMDNHSDRCAYREGYAIDRAMRYGNKFDFVWPDFHPSSGQYFAKRRGLQQPRFFESFFYQRQRKPRAVHWHVQVAQNVRQRADVVLVAMRQHNRANVRAVLL